MTEDEFDARVQSLPAAYGVRLFKEGISKLSQVTGPERKSIAKILIACLVGKIPSQGITAARSLLDFIHLAQYPSHDGRTLRYMQEVLDSWHANRVYFKNICSNFNIPKFHSLLHYIPSIKKTGTTDNANTEMFERLHIDFAKDGWRASNKRDAFPQMINWLARQEKVAAYNFHRQWKSHIELDEDGLDDDSMPVITINVDEEVALPSENKNANLGVRIAKRAPEPKKPVIKIARDHHAPTFIPVLKLFLNGLRYTPLSKPKALETPLIFDSLDVWHQVKISPPSLFEDERCSETVKAVPICKRSVISRFDTILVLDNLAAESTGVAGKKNAIMSLPCSYSLCLGCRAGRIRVIFCLPDVIGPPLLLRQAPEEWKNYMGVPLAFVEWYSKFKDSPNTDTLMYAVDKLEQEGVPRQADIIPVANIRQCCMLTPNVSSKTNWETDWESSNILDQCKKFLVNNFQSKYAFGTIY